MAAILMELLNVAFYIPFLKVDEEDIGRNMKKLKKYQWFHDYLDDKKYRELIVHDKDVRQTIGKFKSDKLDRSFYNKKCQERLNRVLLTKVG